MASPPVVDDSQYQEDAQMNQEPDDVPMEVPEPLVEVSPAREEPDQASEMPWGQPPDDHHESPKAITFIGEVTPTIEVNFQDFVRVARPLLHNFPQSSRWISS